MKTTEPRWWMRQGRTLSVQGRLEEKAWLLILPWQRQPLILDCGQDNLLHLQHPPLFLTGNSPSTGYPTVFPMQTLKLADQNFLSRVPRPDQGWESALTRSMRFRNCNSGSNWTTTPPVCRWTGLENQQTLHFRWRNMWQSSTALNLVAVKSLSMWTMLSTGSRTQEQQ